MKRCCVLLWDLVVAVEPQTIFQLSPPLKMVCRAQQRATDSLLAAWE